MFDGKQRQQASDIHYYNQDEDSQYQLQNSHAPSAISNKSNQQKSRHTHNPHSNTHIDPNLKHNNIKDSNLSHSLSKYVRDDHPQPKYKSYHQQQFRQNDVSDGQSSRNNRRHVNGQIQTVHVQASNPYNLTFQKQKVFPFRNLNLNDKQHIKNNLFNRIDPDQQHQCLDNPQNKTKIFNGANEYAKQYKQTMKQRGGSQSQNYRDFIEQVKRANSIKQMYQNLKMMEKQRGDIKYRKQRELRKILEDGEHIDEVTKMKLDVLLNMSVYRNLCRKRNSVRLNIEILRDQIEQAQQSQQNNSSSRQRQIKVEITQADRKRYELLQLLRGQLDKKIFIQSLRYNKMYKFCQLFLSSLDYNSQQVPYQNQENSDGYQQQLFNNQFISTHINKQQYNTRHMGKPSHSPMYTTSTPIGHAKRHENQEQLQELSPYYKQNRIIIFNQILTLLINKSLYPAFRSLKQITASIKDKNKSRTQANNNQYIMGLSRKQLQHEKLHHQSPHSSKFDLTQSQRSEISGTYDYKQNYTEQQMEQQNPIQAINSYIQQLKKQISQQPNSKQQLLKNYFLKWKIFFLTNIISKIRQEKEEQASKQQLIIDQNQLIQRNPRQLNKGEKKHSQQTGKNQRLESELQAEYKSNKSIQADLKQQKSRLKQLLKHNQKLIFYKLLRENKAGKDINKITEDYYTKNLLKRTFQTLYDHKQNQLNQKWLEVYCQNIAENQYQQGSITSKFFYQTNTKFKTFFALKNIVKFTRLTYKIQKFALKYCFNRIKSNTSKEIQNQLRLKRFEQKKKRKTLFKYLNLLKSETSYADKLTKKVLQFRLRKRLQTLEICFSALCLQWKKQLAIQKKIQNVICSKLAHDFFDKLRMGVKIKQQQQVLQYKAFYALQNYRKAVFFHNLKVNYIEHLKTKRLDIKQAKLQIQLTRNQAKKQVMQWRRQTLLGKNYRMIERKLKKVKQVQNKQKLFRIWYGRLVEKYQQKKKDKLTTNHRIWLNKYYDKLCAIQQEQIS